MHKCGANRSLGEVGVCGAGSDVYIASSCAHFGEEPFLTGKNGAGTIFFSYCNSFCVFCQNYQISHEHLGSILSIGQLAQSMLELQKRGCHNIDLVSPTHYIPQIVEAVALAADNGLSIPLVYNTNSYDSIETLRLLDGIVDIYLPDIKYGEDIYSLKYSGLPNYVASSRKALREMFYQVGLLACDDNDIARKGMVVRHLVLPNGRASSFETFDYLFWLSPDIHLCIMGQYNPLFCASEYEELSRKVSAQEYQEVVDYAIKKGFANILVQELTSSSVYIPDFGRECPFED
ncbi:MAG TPA: radical SAM protein [Candidatus Margulisbacteria bacterium]|nr:MAG: hypothetical protein A2X43_12195 [Candidatus Margulisbacteria bacterium GWD2_39_127]OGI03217.1 MAG: hypothetical protein A2X42_11435 [Candidatus Margulisbacteria bacterium GWF2_38_17]OGI11241.1 MAG: hypothetical protein A2X41_03860 [Candidatus Margulisbacteria bacterium GWE2_39_32]HAR63889.1 radical SAM protein [Candidatus Margulisiibacteriota bacterium]HCT85874.1 radical SAM protein [Candidatus Margulisiibacteriota bacterium]